jgi:hypothetical protein
LRDGCLRLEVPELYDKQTGQPVALRGAVRVGENDSSPESVWGRHVYDLTPDGKLTYRGVR